MTASSMWNVECVVAVVVVVAAVVFALFSCCSLEALLLLLPLVLSLFCRVCHRYVPKHARWCNTPPWEFFFFPTPGFLHNEENSKQNKETVKRRVYGKISPTKSSQIRRLGCVHPIPPGFAENRLIKFSQGVCLLSGVLYLVPGMVCVATVGQNQPCWNPGGFASGRSSIPA